jgi:hypothetical protein
MAIPSRHGFRPLRVPRRLIQQHREHASYDLCVANVTTIHPYRWLPLSLNLALCRDFTWRFVVADITHPLIGVGFLSHFGLLVDCRNNHLLDGVTSLSSLAQPDNSLIRSIKTLNSSTRQASNTSAVKYSLASQETCNPQYHGVHLL